MSKAFLRRIGRSSIREQKSPKEVISKLFVDTSYMYALLNERDEWHQQAKKANALFDQSDLFLTTDMVLTEFASQMSSLNKRKKAAVFISSVRTNPQFKIYQTTEDLFELAFARYSKHSDKEWSLVDCASFIVMEETKTQNALTSDHHFEQAGFVALLRQMR